MNTETIVLGGGCFWCTEATFSMLKGVQSVVPGYAGGTTNNPSYERVCTGATGHAEVVRVSYDPAVISFEDLLTVFFAVHDPMTLNRQGHDVGTQYRSVIFFTSKQQQEAAIAFIAKLQMEEFRDSPIVTELKPLEIFYEAEEYHHEYFKKNPDQAYCQAVINPKTQKLRKSFASLLK